ncbi:hypothetical protein C8J56DRAFT_907150 [Mycena floridula]|nr:hypothetical protein C8J56DRAFT_907150 [Mycena floridula]
MTIWHEKSTRSLLCGHIIASKIRESYWRSPLRRFFPNCIHQRRRLDGDPIGVSAKKLPNLVSTVQLGFLHKPKASLMIIWAPELRLWDSDTLFSYVANALLIQFKSGWTSEVKVAASVNISSKMFTLNPTRFPPPPVVVIAPRCNLKAAFGRFGRYAKGMGGARDAFWVVTDLALTVMGELRYPPRPHQRRLANSSNLAIIRTVLDIVRVAVQSNSALPPTQSGSRLVRHTGLGLPRRLKGLERRPEFNPHGHDGLENSSKRALEDLNMQGLPNSFTFLPLHAATNVVRWIGELVGVIVT